MTKANFFEGVQLSRAILARCLAQFIGAATAEEQEARRQLLGGIEAMEKALYAVGYRLEHEPKDRIRARGKMADSILQGLGLPSEAQTGESTSTAAIDGPDCTEGPGAV